MFAKKLPLAKAYNRIASKYILALNKCPGGHYAKNKLAFERVQLLFLMRSNIKIVQKPKIEYDTLKHLLHEKPRKYNELHYAMYLAMLKIEFYLIVFKLFCKKGDLMFYSLLEQKW